MNLELRKNIFTLFFVCLKGYNNFHFWLQITFLIKHLMAHVPYFLEGGCLGANIVHSMVKLYVDDSLNWKGNKIMKKFLILSHRIPRFCMTYPDTKVAPNVSITEPSPYAHPSRKLKINNTFTKIFHDIGNWGLEISKIWPPFIKAN